MRAALLGFLLATVALAQDTRPDDPASLLPRGTSIFVEASDLSGAAHEILKEASAADTLLKKRFGEEAVPDDPTTRPASRPRTEAGAMIFAAEVVLRRIWKLGARRTAFAFLPSILGSSRWLILAETSDPAPIAAELKKTMPEAKPVTAELQPFFVIADSDSTLQLAQSRRDGKDTPLAWREEFRRYRSRTAGGVMGFYLDVGKLVPPVARIGVLKKDDAGAVFFGSHLMHAIKTARILSGGFARAGRLSLDVFAEVDPVPSLRAFTESRPTQPVVAPPEGCVARISLTRDLKQFWEDRERLLDEKARGSFAEFQTNLGVLMGGMTVEDLFASLGSAYDLYVMRGAGGAPARRYPSAALVAVLADPALGPELLLSFQTTIGIVNAQRAQENSPRFLQESTVHRDVPIACARFLPSAFGDAEDDRLQLEPSFATVKDRVILGTSRAAVRALVDQVLDGKTQPRVPGDEIEATGPAASAALLDAAAIVRSQLVLKENHTEESARQLVEDWAGILEAIDRGSASFDIEGTLARLTLRIGPVRLLRTPESR